MSGVLNKMANSAHGGAVLGAMSLLGWQVYQIGRNTMEYRSDMKAERKNDHLEMMEKISEKVKEESMHNKSFDSIPDRYEPEDDSYLKKVPKL